MLILKNLTVSALGILVVNLAAFGQCPERTMQREAGMSAPSATIDAPVVAESGPGCGEPVAPNESLVEATAKGPVEPRSTGARSAQRYVADLTPDAALWNQHVQTLTSPAYEGRAPGTKGIERAADYIEFHFREYGLEPPFPKYRHGAGNTDYRQEFVIPGSPASGYESRGRLSIDDVDLVAGEDFIISSIAGVGNVSGPLAFVGYGVEEGPGGYSSFDDESDLTGRIALLLRLEPLTEDGRSRWGATFTEHSSLTEKVDAVIKRGAAGILITNPPGADADLSFRDPFAAVVSGCGSLPRIPTAVVSQATADRMLALADPKSRDLQTWRRLADEGSVRTVTFDDDMRISLRSEVKFDEIRTDNVAAVLPGSGSLKDEWIVIGAHYDALGRHTGGGGHEIYPGADDNASGTAAVLILAKRLAEAYASAESAVDQRSILLVAFSAEERGLLGSKHLVEHLPVPTEKIQAMVNLDMIGRLREDTVWFSGAGSAEEFSNLLKPIFEDSDLHVIAESGGLGSDHVSFWNAGVPAVHAMTGGHDELHTSADSGMTMDPVGAVKVIDLTEAMVGRLAKYPSRLTYLETRSEPSSDPCARRPGTPGDESTQSSGCGSPGKPGVE